MIIHDKTLISEEIFEEKFVCDLKACKGACCVEGDGGAPLTKREAITIEKNWDKIKKHLDPKPIAIVEKEGFSTIGADGNLETPLMEDGQECVYTIFEEDGTAKCGIEKAYREGEIDFMKPISCHLYPIRTHQLPTFEAVNYHRWGICKDACSLGCELKVPIFKFLKEPLIRKYGEDWYKGLVLIGEEYLKNNA